jgi:D-3-phosphoglycerate dehydrogenase
MALLAEVADTVVAPDPSVTTLKRVIAGADALLARTAPIPAELIDAAPRLRVIARHGVGVDNIAVDAATRRGIPVAYTPEANKNSVAEHALALILALAKQLPAYDRATRAGEWGIRDRYAATDLAGKTLGVVGMGRIGTLIARKAAAGFDMRVVAVDPYVPRATIAATGAEPLEALDDLLPLADVLTLHVPLLPSTRGLVAARELGRMKPTAILINTARGGVVDEPALYDALVRGTIRAAGLDVFEEEPAHGGHPLFRLPNVLVTPHAAALTGECVVRMATGAAQAIADVLRGGRPAHVVNPEVYAR